MKCNYKLIAVVFLFLLPGLALSQMTMDYLNDFNDGLMINFIGPLRAKGVKITPELRAKCIAYQLYRHVGSVEPFDTDRIEAKKLEEQVRTFIRDNAPEDWPIIKGGMNGEYNKEIEALLGGPVYVEPIIKSLDPVASERKTHHYSEKLYEGYSQKEKIKNTAERFLHLFKEKSYQELQPLMAGHLADEWEKVKEEMSRDTEQRRRIDSFADRLVWRFVKGGVSETDPPMAELIFTIVDNEEMVDYEMFLILDNSRWKVIAFDPN